jgi:hypothetical protein
LKEGARQLGRATRFLTFFHHSTQKKKRAFPLPTVPGSFAHTASLWRRAVVCPLVATCLPAATTLASRLAGWAPIAAAGAAFTLHPTADVAATYRRQPLVRPRYAVALEAADAALATLPAPGPGPADFAAAVVRATEAAFTAAAPGSARVEVAVVDALLRVGRGGDG